MASLDRNSTRSVTVGNRVLMLLENNPYPQDPRVQREAQTLVSAGCRVTVICPRRKGQLWRETLDGVSLYRYPAPKLGNGMVGYAWEYGYSLVASFFLLLLVLFREGFDVIHAHNPPDFPVVIAIVYRLLGKRFVFDHHDLAPELYSARSRSGGNRSVVRILKTFEKLSCKMADHVIATNESYKQMEMTRDGIAEERITIVRNGPDLERLRRVSPDHEIRKRAGTIIGYVGVMGIQDGLDYLLRALHHLRDDMGRADFFCVLMGRGTALPELKKLTEELDLQDHVRFTGRVVGAELARYLSSCDIFVDPDPSTPYNDRSTMIKIMEYMTFERPIVAFDLPEHRVSADNAAVYAQPNDELDFARCIARLMDDTGMCERLGRIGRGRVESHLSWAHQEKALLAAYEKIGVALSWPEPVDVTPVFDTQTSKP